MNCMDISLVDGLQTAIHYNGMIRFYMNRIGFSGLDFPLTY